jgi:hypothetical protein
VDVGGGVAVEPLVESVGVAWGGTAVDTAMGDVLWTPFVGAGSVSGRSSISGLQANVADSANPTTIAAFRATSDPLAKRLRSVAISPRQSKQKSTIAPKVFTLFAGRGA